MTDSQKRKGDAEFGQRTEMKRTRRRVDVVQDVLFVELVLSLLLVSSVLGLTSLSLYTDEHCLYLRMRYALNLAPRIV
jgi:hypothetical protein